MEHLPVETVGDILSRIADARPVVLASATCQKWRQAFRDHLRVLSFRWEDWRGFRRLRVGKVETLMSRTISQTTSLQSLVIEIDREFSISAMMSWLLHTRKSLRVFRYDVDCTYLPLSVVEICRRCEKLEQLTLAHGVIGLVNPDCHQFSSLKSLSLKGCRLPEPDLSALLSVCPNLESLELIEQHCERDQRDLKVVAPPNIRRICFDYTNFEELILESDGVEDLHLLSVTLCRFKLIGKDTLKNFRIENADLYGIDISGSGENLEAIDVIDTIIPHSKLNRLISESSRLQTLSLWNVTDRDGDEPSDLEFIATSCPQLSHLSLGCELVLRDAHLLLEEDGIHFPFCLGGSACFQSVIYLKVGWPNKLADKFQDEFFDLAEGLLERCPSLKKLVIDDGIFHGLKNHGDVQVTARIFRITSKISIQMCSLTSIRKCICLAIG